MLYKYYNSSDERLLKEKAVTVFKEVSSGVYHVVKDRKDNYFNSFIKAGEVVEALNNQGKVFVIGNSGIYANFALEKPSKTYVGKL